MQMFHVLCLDLTVKLDLQGDNPLILAFDYQIDLALSRRAKMKCLGLSMLRIGFHRQGDERFEQSTQQCSITRQHVPGAPPVLSRVRSEARSKRAAKAVSAK